MILAEVFIKFLILKIRGPYKRHHMNVSGACNLPQRTFSGTRIQRVMNLTHNIQSVHTGVKRLDTISSAS